MQTAAQGTGDGANSITRFDATDLLADFARPLQARISPSHKFFDFDEEGRLANVVIARHEDWSAGDYVAWYPDDPAHWWVHRGMFDLLGWPCLAIHLEIQKPIPIWRSPKTWSDHRRWGVVALDWPTARITLSNVPLIAEDLQHAEEIERHYRRPQPKILLRSPGGLAV